MTGVALAAAAPVAVKLSILGLADAGLEAL